eukprot:TRINITY_DN25408_c0_g1_i1.p1 TRINITY_DN25408_c0_g1~~TRINITY_DN25408_c0_g1_i1.p1  ORF type:complete len:184 (+),score=59.67 TRINITY_DN25408_c0_g1_i1:127-678(+)
MAGAAMPTLLLAGGQGAGVTTLLEQLRAHGKGMCVPGRTLKLHSTVGQNVVDMKVNGQGLKVIEVGGVMLSHAYRQIDVHDPLSGVLYVIDLSSPKDLAVTAVELYNLIANEKLRAQHVPFLVVLNKSDAPSRLPFAAAVEHLGLAHIDADVQYIEASGSTGHNVGEIADWVADKVLRHLSAP